MITEELSRLFKEYTGGWPVSVQPQPGSGSGRSYFRMLGSFGPLMGAFNEDITENRAFYTFTRHFLKCHLPVPELFSVSPDERMYLVQDLGDMTLYRLHGLSSGGNGNPSPEVGELYRKSLSWLASFQMVAGKDLDYSACYPRQHFDRQSVMWDLHYFKYYFLKLTGISYNEQFLEDDFNRLADHLGEAESGYFLYRDFQSRNIMVKDKDLFFIDYQGGRRGALPYDVASLLYDAKADLPEEFREELLTHYLELISTGYGADTGSFLRYYPAFVLVRILQAMGAYGFRGYFERKAHFLRSIPFALRNIRQIAVKHKHRLPFPLLLDIIDRMTDERGGVFHRLVSLSGSDSVPEGKDGEKRQGLLVRINSFSYRRSIPEDCSGNGGGYVFDCRALPNPGRLDLYKEKTGLDPEVSGYLESFPEVDAFFNQAALLVYQSIENYLQRGFQHLLVSFGCTGGRHRSVYFADRLYRKLLEDNRIKVVVRHTEQESL